MAITVKATLDTNKGFKELNQFKKDFNRLAQEWVQVGFDSSEIHHTNERGKKEDVNMAELAAWLHEGTKDGRIPPRPFFEGTLQQMMGKSEANKLVPLVKKLYMGFGKGKNLNKHITDFLEGVGEHLKKKTQDNFGIDNTIGLVDNAPSTIKQKGRNDPLVDTHKLRDGMLVKTSK
jgi:hypothetical protein